jgi:hypothetical protein
MALCPSGHESATTDYCDTCGALMGGAPVTAASAASASASLSASASASGLESSAVFGGGGSGGGDPETCPQCGAARDGRFCEECGFDYELAELVPPTETAAAQSGNMRSGNAETESASQAPAQGGAPSPDYDLDAEFAAAERAFAESGGASAIPAVPETGTTAEPSGNSAGSGPTAPGSGTSAAPTPAAARSLAAVVTADHEYYTAQVERGDIVAADFPFPKYPGERRFALDGDRVRIGRASASRGIAVEIDLTGPPLDPAVSHLHAQLLRTADGSWAVVDLNSANGTRVNGAEDPLPAETEVPVGAGDRIHVGVWTTLTLEEA